MEKDDRYTRITLRIPKDLHARLADAADETSKSMNAEIIARLEASFSAPEKIALPLTTRIRREVLSGEEAGQAIPGSAKHELTDQQLWDVITAVLNSVTGHDQGRARPSRGPTPRSKFPKR